MASALHNLSDYDINSVPDATGLAVGIVVSEWNDKITGALLEGAVRTLVKHGVREEDITVKTVPGSFELIYGLLTCNTLEQAEQRCGGMLGNKGDECAVTAIKMAKGWVQPPRPEL